MRNMSMKSWFAIVFAGAMFVGCSSKSTEAEDPVAAEASGSEEGDATETPSDTAALPPQDEPTDQDIGSLEGGEANVAVEGASETAPFPEPEAMPTMEDAAKSPAPIPEPVLNDVPAPAMADVNDSSDAEGDYDYIVMPGDTLGKIAKRLYGSAKMYKKLASQNQMADPNKIFPGDKIKFSAKHAVKKFKNGSGQVAKTTKIKRGESLSKVAERLYGQSDYWRMLWKYNISSVPNPNRVSVGQSLSYIVLPNTGKATTH